MKRLWARLQSKTRTRETGDASRRPLPLKELALRRADTVGINGLSAIHILCASSRADCLELILKSRQKLNLNAHSRKTLTLEGEPRTGSPWIVRWSCVCQDNGMTALHLAVVARSSDCVRLLLTKGAKPDVMAGEIRDGLPKTPLDYACLLGEVHIMCLLLDHGAEVNHCPLGGQAPIHYVLTHCRYCDHMESVQLLLERGADPNIRAKGDVSFLAHLSLTNHELGISNYYNLGRGYITGSSNRNGDVPLHYAALQGQWKTVELLLKSGADAKQLGGMNWTTLHCAAVGGSVEAVSLLINENAPLSTVDDDGNTPLHLSVMEHHYGCARLLLEHGADPNVSGFDGYPSPLMLVLKSTAAPVNFVKLLVSEGADVNYSYARIPSRRSRFPSFFPTVNPYQSVFNTAIERHGPDILKILLASGADTSCFDGDGNTKLMKACRSINCQSPKVIAQNVRLLAFVKGMDLNHCNPDSGHTALHMCAVNGLTDAARVLLEVGANPSVVNVRGLTPQEECKSEETRAVFQEYAG